MKDYVKRMIKEHKELECRIEKLDKFINAKENPLIN